MHFARGKNESWKWNRASSWPTLTTDKAGTKIPYLICCRSKNTCVQVSGCRRLFPRSKRNTQKHTIHYWMDLTTLTNLENLLLLQWLSIRSGNASCPGHFPDNLSHKHKENTRDIMIHHDKHRFRRQQVSQQIPQIFLLCLYSASGPAGFCLSDCLWLHIWKKSFKKDANMSNNLLSNTFLFCFRGNFTYACLTTWQGPRQGHEEVTEVIGMTNKTPPAWHQQSLSCCRGDGLQSWAVE